MPKNRTDSHKILLYSVLGSVGLLAVFLLLQGVASSLLQLPSQWLWVSLVPVVVGLIAGGYIVKFKASSSGVELEGPGKELEALPEATPGTKDVAVRAAASTASWQNQRQQEYVRADGLFLVHVYKPSSQGGQDFDVFVYLVRHNKNSIRPTKTGFTDVKQVEFYFGAAWGHEVFTVLNAGQNILGVRTHAYGTFLATCRVTFNDEKKEPIIIHRYLDCEMLAYIT
jgi:hypothetical protein